tara:strand:+ start:23 stop:166 length:144 start_codon:yes stop_codon:yes gene_type:complete
MSPIPPPFTSLFPPYGLRKGMFIIGKYNIENLNTIFHSLSYGSIIDI